MQIEDVLRKAENSQIRPTEIRTLIINAANGLTNASQVQMESAVRSLLNYYGATTLPKPYFHYEEKDFKRGYTKPELNTLIGYLDKPLEKLYVFIGAESGLRADTILLLKWKHIEQDFNARTDSIALRLELPFYIGRKKAGRTFIGLRSRDNIKSCIETGLIKTRSEEPLFPYKYTSILKIVTNAYNKAKLDPSIPKIHGLRKYFKAGLQSPTPPIDEYYQRMMMGRFNDTDAKAYSPRDFETLRPEYEHAYPYLDYMNNAPEQAQELSTKQTELQDLIREQNARIQTLQDQAKQHDSQLTTTNQALSALGDMFSQAFAQALPRDFQNNASNLSLREIMTELIPRSIKIGRELGLKAPPNYVEVATKGAQEIPDEELREIEELAKKGDYATAFAKMTKYVPIELSQYQK
jgi:integrase